MKAKKKHKSPAYGGTLKEVTVTPYTKDKYAFEDRMSNKAKGNIDPSYPIFDALLGKAFLKPLKKGAKSVVKKAFGKKTTKKASKAKVLKYRGVQSGLAAKDVNEYTQ